tara:strand:+ start:16079 stop:17350 length:1272 start_codon:yes stop_codon:yes gene_type:complete
MLFDNKKICIVGLGYVGLPLAVAFAQKFKIVGYDIDDTRIKSLKSSKDKTFEVDDLVLDSVKSNIFYTSNIQDTTDCKIFIITVPTPIDKANRPDLNPLVNSTMSIGSVLKKEDIVIYESTVYPGVTREICVPALEKSSGLIFNKDFFCGYSPERVSPGDKKHTVTKILKVTSGSTPDIANQVDRLYKEIIVAGTYLAPSIEVAEASKAIENTQRDVNIALINEFALILDQLGIDTNEVIKAAATKWNFINFLPGLVGGHCIGVDPYYLTFKAEEMGYKPNLILAARQINNGMSKYIADKTINEMIKAGKTIRDSEILILGFTFKENCPDTRNTRVLDIVNELNNFGTNIDIFDPWIDSSQKNYNHRFIKDPLKSDKKYDSVIVAVSHKQFKSYTANDFSRLSIDTKVIIDIKNIVDDATWRL